jgi:hypothetical protein
MKTVIMYSLVEVLIFGLLFFSILTQLRVARSFKFTEPTLTLSTLFISLTLVMLAIACSLNIATAVIKYDNENKESELWHQLDVIADTSVTLHLYF